MKVYLGPYTNWIGPYQLAGLLKRVGVSDDRCHQFGEWLADTWVHKLCVWIESKKKRKVKVKIHNYDTWSTNTTLAIIIVPLLKQLKKTKHGSPFVDDADVPEHLRSTVAPPVKHQWDADDLFHDRWDYVLDEMIWAMEQCLPDNDWEAQFYVDGFNKDGYHKYQQRITKGLTLFGKYFQALWD